MTGRRGSCQTRREAAARADRRAGGRQHDRGTHSVLGDVRPLLRGDAPLLFTENETNNARLHLDTRTRPYRQGRHQRLRRPRPHGCGQPRQHGTKAAAHYRLRSPRRVGDGAAAPDRPARRAAHAGEGNAAPSGRTSTRSSPPGGARPTRSTRRSRPPWSRRMQRNVMRQALAGMLWTKQYYYFDVDRGSRSTTPTPSITAAATPQPRMVPHGQRRHHLDARQVGVPLVRRLGPRLPHLAARHRRPRLRQAAAATDAARVLPASERPASRPMSGTSAT